MDILINKSRKEHNTLVFTYFEESNLWKTHTVNISVRKVNGVTQNNLVLVAKEAKKVILESSRKGKNSKSDKGRSYVIHPHVMVAATTPLKILYQ